MTLPDIDSLALFGGALNDFAPVTDPTTDRPSGGATGATSGSNVAYADVAMATWTQMRSWVQFTGAASTGAMVLVNHASLWGNGPSVAPTLARSGTGVYTITLPSTVQDQLLVSHTVNLRWAKATYVNAAGALMPADCSVSANVITIKTYNTSASAHDATGITLNVEAF